MGSADRNTIRWMRYRYEDKWIEIFMKPPLPGGRKRVYVCSQSTKSEDVLMLSATAMRRLEALEDSISGNT